MMGWNINDLKKLTDWSRLERAVKEVREDKREMQSVVKRKYVELECFGCKLTFMVLTEHEGVITCPYCGDLVED